jgi:hypothetical protein
MKTKYLFQEALLNKHIMEMATADNRETMINRFATGEISSSCNLGMGTATNAILLYT